MTQAIFEPIDETRIEVIDGGISITQQGFNDGEPRVVFIPGRYVGEFTRELGRVSKLIPAGQEG